MQRVLEKMAKKLNEYDESSLMQLWQQYATRVRDFEPTRRWEEAAIALCLIQAVHWKNQLFNYHLALLASPADKAEFPPLPDFFTAKKKAASTGDGPKRPKATVLSFPDKNAGRKAGQPHPAPGSDPKVP
jgi:hypothetical protein